MKVEDCADTDEIFTHQCDGVVRHFNATKMAAFARQNKEKVRRHTFPLDPKQVEFIRKSGGIEQWKLDRLADPWIEKPIVVVEFEGGLVTIVDGNHRFVKKFENGEKKIRGYYFPFGVWEPFLLEDCAGLTLEHLAMLQRMLPRH